jgi:hypothetical protein
VATISNGAADKGTATTSATNTGVTTITATDPVTMIAGSTQLTVANITLLSIIVTPANSTIAQGARIQYVATGVYSDGSQRILTQFVSWSSSSPSVANPSNGRKKKGIVVGKHNGSATITATTQGISGSTTLMVSSGTLSSITISPTSPSIPNHTKQQFVATGHYTDGSSSDITAIVSWTSSSTAVASISNGPFIYGQASASSAGMTTIKATDSSGLFATTTLTVTSATLVSIEVTPNPANIQVGLTQQMTAVGTFSDNSTKDITIEVTWTVVNGALASAINTGSQKGTVQTTTIGNTTVRANFPQSAVSGSANLHIF